MARFYTFHVGDLARVLTLRCMVDAYEYTTMPEGEEKRKLLALMRELTAKYGDEIGHIRAVRNGLVQMDYHCQNRWFHDWMVIPTQVRPLDESAVRGR
ncbi:MAG: hypothetical protein IJ767_04200 [Bacteroidaceae bacterium]|nr:hypothetical protein [Bacteroidaceae bacterium]